MDLRSSKFLILDCQTTGMQPSVGSLLEFCWATASASCESIDIRGGLVELPAGEEIPARVREITGLRASDLKDARPSEILRSEFEEALNALIQESEDGARPIAVIHYAQFEESWLRDLLDSVELPFDVLCTHKISKKLLPTVPSRNVRALSGYFGMRIGEIKRAHQHVKATQKIWSALVPALADIGITTVEGLRSWLSEKATLISKKSKAAVKAPSYEYRVDRERRLALPAKPGIYKMIAKSGEILYVGKATSLKDRVNSYFRGKKGRDPRKLELMAQVWDLEVVECESAIEAALIESDEIKRLDPPYNVSLKQGNRALLYYDRALETESLVQSTQHPVGPFRRFNTIEHLRIFAQGLRSDLIPNVFYQPIDDATLEEGYALFEQKYPRYRPEGMTTRDHVAFGLKLLRTEAETETETDTETDTVSDTEAALSPLEVCEKIERLYLRAARTYLRAKQVTRLLWADIRWNEKGEPKMLRVRGGQLIANPNLERPPHGLAPWQGLAIADYDRMSVLLMEISKIDHEIQPVR